MVNGLVVVLRRQIFGYANRVVNRSDFADADDIEIVLLQSYQQILRRRSDGVIVTVFRALEIPFFADERTRNDAPDFVFAV